MDACEGEGGTGCIPIVTAPRDRIMIAIISLGGTTIGEGL
jgi:hypothetical protein